VPGIIHDANAVLGRANRFLASRVSAIATSLPGVLDRDPDLAGKATTVGNADAPGDSGPLLRCHLRRPNRTGRFASSWSAAARARAS